MSAVDTAYAISDIAAGTAAEHLTTAVLLLAGFNAFMVGNPQAPYDVAMEALGRLLRVQVKATRGPRLLPGRVAPQSAYCFDVRRKIDGIAAPYGLDDFDLLALVAIDTQQIAWLPAGQHSAAVSIYPDGEGRGKHFDDLTLEAALAALPKTRRRKAAVA